MSVLSGKATLVAPLPDGDIEAEVTTPVFYDERNERRDGGGA